MPTIIDIEPMRDLLFTEWASIDDLVADLDEERFSTPTCLPGWSVKDVLSHVAGVELMLDGVPAPDVDVSHLEHLRNDIARMGEVWVEDMRPLSGADVRERYRAVIQRRRAALSAMTQADFDAPSWTPVGKDETYGRFMRVRHFDCFMHEHDMRDALAVADREDPDAIRSALSEVEPSLGYIVGRKAQMPEGSTVRIVLTGPVDEEYLIAVEGRATVVDHLDGDPTASLSMPAMRFLRLTGGRCDPEAHLGAEVQLGGDESLARQLASNLTFTI